MGGCSPEKTSPCVGPSCKQTSRGDELDPSGSWIWASSEGGGVGMTGYRECSRFEWRCADVGYEEEDQGSCKRLRRMRDQVLGTNGRCAGVGDERQVCRSRQANRTRGCMDLVVVVQTEVRGGCDEWLWF
ncbi:hypothetical protein C1H46_000524 [Malus baccata]|uniref:Uncharacterized protein n=1 Tax=Malus baccata TaxID=106549 RepID=A0A540NTB5_MALBA|nr:hypothetical protein C1H46_000524 [Malus baccata]